jgi:hypothetical protein
MGHYPFAVFYTSQGPTLCIESELKRDLSVGVLSSCEEVWFFTTTSSNIENTYFSERLTNFRLY